jgi:FkbM family methyltransferase
MDQHSFLTVQDGIQFRRSASPFRQITDAAEYCIGDIRPDDVVVDIGANIGAFCLRAARIARRVTAVEPVACSLLRENIRLNGADVRVIEGALGDGKPNEICWDECTVISQTYPLRAIREIAGGCDFLKCDCEGAEWLINPEELSGIRRIEMELHIPPISGPPRMELLDWIGRHYDFAIDRKPCHDILGVMGVLHAELK